MFFFVKQKTAYEMRISDWSSDVCSSDLGRKRRGDAPNRLVDRRQALHEADGIQYRQPSRIADRVQYRPLTLAEGERLPQTLRNHQDVGEDDRRIHTEPADRLQRDLGRPVGRVATGQKAAGLGPDRERKSVVKGKRVAV